MRWVNQEQVETHNDDILALQDGHRETLELIDQRAAETENELDRIGARSAGLRSGLSR